MRRVLNMNSGRAIDRIFNSLHDTLPPQLGDQWVYTYLQVLTRTYRSERRIETESESLQLQSENNIMTSLKLVHT